MARIRRPLVERTHCIDIRKLKRHGQITHMEANITLQTAADGRLTRVALAHLERPVLGGIRTYFRCPKCDRRCDLLYSHPHLACRVCHHLAFASENETSASRALRRLIKARQRLGQVEGGVIAPFPSKPKWGRWPRYLRTRREAMAGEREYWATVGVARLKRLQFPAQRDLDTP